MRRTGLALTVGVCALCLVVVLAGCTGSRSKDRLKVIEAENIDLRQQNTNLARTSDEARLNQDRALVELQQERHAANLARREAEEGQQAVNALGQIQSENAVMAQEIAARRAEVERMRQEMAARVRPAAPTPVETVRSGPGPELEAFQRDLERKFSTFQVAGLSVEQRTSHDGQLRVAVVLQNAFPAGKDSLAYNMDAVRAVASLGQLITASYPNSSISVEGHTDSDPIRKSKWSSNEHLSRARAEAVKELLNRAGIDTTRISVTGLGASQPVAAGSTPRAKSKNRRVEIYIEPSV